MVVLLLFNECSSWIVQQMQDTTQIKTELLLEVLYDLLKNKLLKCLEIDNDKVKGDFNENDIKMNYTIQINDDFEQ